MNKKHLRLAGRGLIFLDVLLLVWGGGLFLSPKGKLSNRIIREREEINSPRTSVVNILELAEPPLHPRYPQKGMATAASMLGGLGAIALGITMLKRSKSPCSPIQS